MPLATTTSNVAQVLVQDVGLADVEVRPALARPAPPSPARGRRRCTCTPSSAASRWSAKCGEAEPTSSSARRACPRSPPARGTSPPGSVDRRNRRSAGCRRARRRGRRSSCATARTRRLPPWCSGYLAFAARGSTGSIPCGAGVRRRSTSPQLRRRRRPSARVWRARPRNDLPASALDQAATSAGRPAPLAPPRREPVAGVDVDGSALDGAGRGRRRHPHAALARADLPFADGAFDLVFTTGVLIHQPQETRSAR